MNSSEDKRSFKRKKPFVNNGFRKPMHQEPRSRISHPQPPSAPKRPNNNSDFTKPELQQQQRNTNTSSLESILKGKEGRQDPDLLSWGKRGERLGLAVEEGERLGLRLVLLPQEYREE